MTTSPSISVVMPVYNGGRYLRQALASIRWQTFSDWEAICVNDGSTDNSLEILKQFAAVDTRFRIINQANAGIVEALNNGIRAARGDWIARMDSDDIAVPQRLAVQYQFVKKDPNVIVVGSNILSIDPDGAPLSIGRYQTDPTVMEELLLNGRAGSLAHPTVLMRRAAVVAAGMYRKEFEWVEDTDLWLRLVEQGPLTNIPRVLLHYRLHEQSVCWSRRELQRQRLEHLLQAARAKRALPVVEAQRTTTRRPRKTSSAAGKWARQAARSGFYQTALKHWLRQARAEPWSLHTLRVTAEMLARASVSLLSRRNQHLDPLPDWRAWDAVNDSSSEQQCQVA